MKRLTFFFLILVGVSSASAQTILMKSGESVPADNMVRNADMVMVAVKTSNGGLGQVGYHVSDIAELNLPEPDVINFATEQVSSGEYDKALAQIQPVVDYQKTLRDIPGNWWAKAALVEVQALAGLNRLPEANALVSEISSFSQDPEVKNSANLQIALITKFTDPKQAIAAFDAILAQSRDPKTVSQAWIAEGDVHFGEHEFDEALMDYLTVTVFYPDHNPLVPKALWLSGQSYGKLKDMANAVKTYQNLISTFPGSPEASLAKAELLKKENKT